MLQKSYHTKTTDLISQFIQQGHENGFTAGELSDFLSKNGVIVNKTTVYRNLDKMTEAGQLVKNKSPVSDGYFYQVLDKGLDCKNHIHFQCSRCGSVLHLSDSATTEYLASISRNLGIEIDLHNSSLSGICPECRKQR